MQLPRNKTITLQHKHTKQSPTIQIFLQKFMIVSEGGLGIKEGGPPSDNNPHNFEFFKIDEFFKIETR